ncbi:inositol monophosphatase family protein [Nitrospirillum iridis]|uniref:Histidinol phosphatase-like enzyme (Inositol monophosphatase family) n=1 Tax=Nitrospirillum iridis TaxID=765888 RepID=A0A7X0B2I0_9PROT|nr:inositol monophosphatase family protein [Nitrospirillum iridis]MBB6254538.1 histidinol phosphatase-like enzyme (inositol monophosphatase family) [Nitrospirillum iridis]
MDAFTAELLRFAEHLADESRVLLEGAATARVNVESKADNSFVTEADRAIEARLRGLIERTYPQHGILGEEYGPHNLEAEIVWVLDPIDGTAPFIAGIPVYGTLIGVSRFGRPWIGALDYPATGDRWLGAAGASASRNGVAIRTRPCAGLGAALMTCSNPDFFHDDEYAALTQVRNAVRYTLYGASSFAYGLLASGRTDLAVDCGLKAYDVFAPAAVISGAGGIVTDWSGADITLGAPVPIVAAGDAALHAQALELLRASQTAGSSRRIKR